MSHSLASGSARGRGPAAICASRGSSRRSTGWELDDRAPATAGRDLRHGTFDPVIAVAFGRAARDTLLAAGGEVLYEEYPLPHTLDPESRRQVRDWLALGVDTRPSLEAVPQGDRCQTPCRTEKRVVAEGRVSDTGPATGRRGCGRCPSGMHRHMTATFLRVEAAALAVLGVAGFWALARAHLRARPSPAPSSRASASTGSPRSSSGRWASCGARARLRLRVPRPTGARAVA